MRLAIFGATGGTGRHLVDHALARGHEVRALVRRPAATPVDPRVSVVVGDVLVPGSCDPVVAGTQAVISAIGPGHSPKDTVVYSVGTRNIVQAMRVHGSRRLVCLSSTGPFLRADPGAGRLFRLVLPAILHKPYADIRRMEELVAASGLDWVVVRATKLTNGRRTGRYRVSTTQTPRGGWRVSRADVAAFLLDQVESDIYLHTTPAIAY